MITIKHALLGVTFLGSLVASPPALAANFTELTLTSDHALGGENLTRVITVNGATGAVTVRSSHPRMTLAPGPYGTATASELQRISDEIEQAAAFTLPATINPQPANPSTPEPWSLNIVSAIQRNNIAVGGDHYGHYGQYHALIDGVTSAVEAILGRLLTQPPPPPPPHSTLPTFDGRVSVAGAQVFITGARGRFRIDEQQAAETLRKFRGFRVSVEGFAFPTVVGASYSDLHVTNIVSPSRERLLGNVDVNPGSGRVTIVRGSDRILALGPTAAVLRRYAIGRDVETDAWVFSDAGGTRRFAYLESVEARATGRTSLWNETSGRFIARPRSGDQVTVISLHRRFRGYAVVETLDYGRGVLRAGRGFVVGLLPATTPLAGPPSAGITGTLPR